MTCVCLVLCVVLILRQSLVIPKKKCHQGATHWDAKHIKKCRRTCKGLESTTDGKTTHYYRCQHVPTYGSFAGQYGETFLLIHQASLSLTVPSTVLISDFALHQGPRDVAVLWLNHCYGSFENASKQGKGCKGCCITGPFQS